MNVASLEPCKELRELSGWNDTCWVWREHLPAPLSKVLTRGEMEYDNQRFGGNRPEQVRFREENRFCSAYDLGYLMRKLPATVDKGVHVGYLRLEKSNHGYALCYMHSDLLPTYHNEADTPEDAAAKLAIELFKQGILKRENTHVQ